MTVQASVTINWAAKAPPWESERTIIQAPIDQIEAKVAAWLAPRVQTLADREASRVPARGNAANPYRMDRSQTPPGNYRGD